jgi:hypothetical protein
MVCLLLFCRFEQRPGGLASAKFTGSLLFACQRE